MRSTPTPRSAPGPDGTPPSAADRRSARPGSGLLWVGLVLSRDVRLPLPDVLGWLTVLAAAPRRGPATGIEATVRAVQTDEGHYARRWFTR